MRISAREQMKIIQAITAARKNAKVSRRGLSNRLGAFPNMIQKIESGERDVTVAEFKAIARALGIDPCELLRRTL